MTEDDRSNLGATAHAGNVGGRVGAATGKKAGAAMPKTTRTALAANPPMAKYLLLFKWT